MSRLLILTFHKASDPNIEIVNQKGLLHEDILFKRHAIDSKLISSDAMDDAHDEFNEVLKENLSVGPASGIVQAEYQGTSLYTLNRVGLNAWYREPYVKKMNKQSVFEKWFHKVVESPIDVLVLAGHHSYFRSESENKRITPTLWGQERRGTHYWYTAFVPHVVTTKQASTTVYEPTFSIMGHPAKGDGKALLRAGPFNMKSALQKCCLLLIMGCNGTTSFLGRLWQNWIHSARERDEDKRKPPLVLGWYGVHAMPRDKYVQHFSPTFWRYLQELCQLHKKGLAEICAEKSDEVIQLWANSLKFVYSDSKVCQKHLWFTDGRDKDCDRNGMVGGGAVDPDGEVWAITHYGEIERIKA